MITTTYRLLQSFASDTRNSSDYCSLDFNRTTYNDNLPLYEVEQCQENAAPVQDDEDQNIKRNVIGAKLDYSGISEYFLIRWVSQAWPLVEASSDLLRGGASEGFLLE